MARWLRRGLAALAVVALAGCEQVLIVPVPAPVSSPMLVPIPIPAGVTTPAPSEAADAPERAAET